MGWDISLVDAKGEIVKVQAHMEGGIVSIPASEEADISVTYNYCKLFDFGQLDKKKAKDTVSLLKEVVEKFGTKRDINYWNCTEGNVGHIAQVLLHWAEMNPEAEWHIWF